MVHGDPRLDNWFFYPEDGETKCGALDWQMMLKSDVYVSPASRPPPRRLLLPPAAHPHRRPHRRPGPALASPQRCSALRARCRTAQVFSFSVT